MVFWVNRKVLFAQYCGLLLLLLAAGNQTDAVQCEFGERVTWSTDEVTSSLLTQHISHSSLFSVYIYVHLSLFLIKHLFPPSLCSCSLWVVAVPTLTTVTAAACGASVRMCSCDARMQKRCGTFSFFLAVFAGVTFALCLYNSEAILQSRQSDDSPDSPSWGPVRSTWSDRWLSVDVQHLFLLFFLFLFPLLVHINDVPARSSGETHAHRDVSPFCLVLLSTYVEVILTSKCLFLTNIVTFSRN